jgi:hypothetical protein
VSSRARPGIHNRSACHSGLDPESIIEMKKSFACTAKWITPSSGVMTKKVGLDPPCHPGLDPGSIIEARVIPALSAICHDSLDAQSISEHINAHDYMLYLILT